MARRWHWVVVVGVSVLAGCSGTSSTAPVLPAGWKTVTYHHIGIDVPAAWIVQPWHPNCGVDSPTVFIGPQGIQAAGCPTYSGGAQVILGATPLGDVLKHLVHINGLGAYRDIYQAPATCHQQNVYMTTYWVQFPRITISVSVGDTSARPGGAPGRAEEIVHTIHALP